MTDENVSFGDHPTQTSLTLLERAKRNENEAWQLLVELYAPLIYSRCRFHWKLAAPDSENIGQEVFVAVARKLGDFERQRIGSFRKWLRVVTDNKCKDFLNGNPSAKAAGGSAARAALANVPDDTLIQHDTNEVLDDRAIVMRQAMKAVEDEFSPRDWKIFWAIAIENKYRQDVATNLGVSDNVVYLAYSRIRKRMREVYEDLIDDDIL